MRVLALVLAMSFVATSAAAEVSTSWRPEDASALAAALLRDERVRAAADERAPFGLVVDVLDGADAAFVYDEGALRPGATPSAYVIHLSTDAALVAKNADAPADALRCLVSSGAVALASPSSAERLALRALASRAAPCSSVGTQIAPGVFVEAGLVRDAFGVPLGWQDRDAARWLGRADAGISRLSPDELPRGATADLADPWLAATSGELRGLLARAADCPCDATPPLVPSGDRQAALKADPRTGGRS